MTQPSFLFRLRQSIRTGYQLHGVGFPFVGLQRLCVSFWRRTFRKSFLFSGEQRQYWIHPYILNNERAVEVSLAHTFLRKPTAATLEVGNVLANFFSFPHDVVDKYEKAPGVLNEDIVSYSPGKKYDFIVTLSTLEHVGWDETPREPEKIIRAIDSLKGLLNRGGELMATMPLGYNTQVDEMVRTQKTGFDRVHYLKRINRANEWVETTLDEVIGAKYGSPYPCGNAIFVGFFRNNNP